MNDKKRGISLIILVITIIVMIIIAAAIILTISGENSIIKRANQATSDSNEATARDKDLIAYSDYELARSLGETTATGTFDEYILNTTYGGIEIGDTVNYNCNGYNGSWKLLGVENGQVMLLSTKAVKNNITLSGADGYINGISTLNDLCSSFAKGNYADKARCLTIDDINEVIEFDSLNIFNTGKPQNYGKIHEYGNVATYKISNNTLYYTGSNGTTGTGADRASGEIKTLLKLDTKENWLAENEEYKVTSVCPTYMFGTQMAEGVVGETLRINVSEKKFMMLRGDSSNRAVWLATQTVLPRAYGISWGLSELVLHDAVDLNADGVIDDVIGVDVKRDKELFSSRKSSFENAQNDVTYDLRAVVYLKENVKFTRLNDGSFNITYK